MLAYWRVPRLLVGVETGLAELRAGGSRARANGPLGLLDRPATGRRGRRSLQASGEWPPAYAEGKIAGEVVLLQW